LLNGKPAQAYAKEESSGREIARLGGLVRWKKARS
jgi:hypothetical protein